MDTASYLKEIIEHLWIAVTAIIAYVFKKYDKRLGDLTVKVTEQDLILAKDYVTREELKDGMEKLESAQREGSERIEEQLREYREDFRQFSNRFIDFITSK